DGKRILAGGCLEVLDATGGKEVISFSWGASQHVLAAAISPDGKRIVGGGADGTVMVWDLAKGLQGRCFEADRGTLHSIAFSPDGKWLVSGGEDGILKIWDATSGKRIRNLVGNSARISCVAFSPDGKRVLSACGDSGTLRVWDATNGELKLTLKGEGN